MKPLSTDTHYDKDLRRCYGWGAPKTYDSLIWKKRYFVAFFWLVGWDCISFGAHIAILQPNIEIHVPFGFFKIGWVYR